MCNSTRCMRANLKWTVSFRQQCPSTPSCRLSLLSIASCKVTVLAKLAAHNSSHCTHVVPKSKVSFLRQCPSTPSRQLSLLSVASSKVVVLAISLWAQYCSLREFEISQFRRCHFVSNAHLHLHANFHRPPMLLATTFAS